MGESVAKAKILIVDDEPVNIHVLSEALQGAHELRFATSGPQAMKLLDSYRPDLILLDVVMPDCDGYQTLEMIQSSPTAADIPVIFVTAMSEIDDEEKGFALGAVDYITKPISAPIVRARVRIHLQLKQQRDLLERSALIDGLTNIANRRSFDQALSRRWRAAQRQGTGIMLMLMDIDHFKQYNDHYGHGAGDDCLRQVAHALDQAFTRGEDLVARYGGEEFALILAADAARDQVARLLSVITELQIEHLHSSAAKVVTASVGAREFPRPGEMEIADALKSVDELLYQAKQAGRNRCALQLEGALGIEMIC